MKEKALQVLLVEDNAGDVRLLREMFSKLMREGAVSYLQKDALEDPEALLRAIDYALLLPRYDEFSQQEFLPNVGRVEKPSK